ncbi:hypothetical protein TpMuguga_05g00025 (apicoplast) [Theileria parva strain Muguga]|uniref:Uncharacterized protein n=1 Tax=Theileria parva TaxID=5875 RepID=Q4MY98_THEPA|nr:hypothetical protein TpMuguga_05g00025 [Theileria parva strain Muguga]|eukprot:XP_762694.1 hypothetical protein (apicoplast) [Theileria parva strain Muguga]
MKKIYLNSRFKGYKKNRNHLLKTNKNFFLGNTNYKQNIFINNKYTLNRYLKFNFNISDNVYNNMLYSYKKVKNE